MCDKTRSVGFREGVVEASLSRSIPNYFYSQNNYTKCKLTALKSGYMNAGQLNHTRVKKSLLDLKEKQKQHL